MEHHKQTEPVTITVQLSNKFRTFFWAQNKRDKTGKPNQTIQINQRLQIKMNQLKLKLLIIKAKRLTKIIFIIFFFFFFFSLFFHNESNCCLLTLSECCTMGCMCSVLNFVYFLFQIWLCLHFNTLFQRILFYVQSIWFRRSLGH